MSAQARERTLDEHTGEHRAREMLDYFEEAFAMRRGRLPAPRRQAQPLERDRPQSPATRASARCGMEGVTS